MSMESFVSAYELSHDIGEKGRHYRSLTIEWQLLRQRERQLQEQIKAYRSEIDRIVNEYAKGLVKSEV